MDDILRILLDRLNVLPIEKFYKTREDYEDTLRDIQDAIVLKLNMIISEVEEETNRDRIIPWEDR